MTKTVSRFVSPTFAVIAKAMRGVRPEYDSRENTIDLSSVCARSACWVFGHARITLVPGTAITPTEGGRTKPADRPLASLLMHIATFDTSTGVTQHLVQVEAVVKAESLVQPLLILAPTRPAAWPL